ncbi:MAG: DNA-directed RNA polymerase subunit alpha [Candidatus Berkelbacteria bacterium Licking1014_7]|uniref:DNA-directed RNA polymerase subunit alpha n=1 Tax=Candidatus Berkelbacteria bacterium Licking1014_7 TaxID=2017147 RepID=A0A554LI61_9BACT|nr:MAG: DNA-directed RNA polymerase subunit alpha [Candidatus Berkelbacteria bacterium Licking1014_7]
MSTENILELTKVKVQKKEKNYGQFIIEPLSPGFGITIANSLRRVILSSIPGAAITTVKINNATHEFSTIKGVKEDLIEIILNLKSLKIKKLCEDKVTIKLSANQAGVVLAKDFKKNPDIEIIEPDHHLATLDKGAKLSIEAVVDSGVGYLPTENREDEKMPLGYIAIDAIFTPIKKISYTVENTRVGQKTDFDKIIFDITTDGSIDPEQTLNSGAQILMKHFEEIFTQTKTNKK